MKPRPLPHMDSHATSDPSPGADAGDHADAGPESGTGGRWALAASIVLPTVVAALIALPALDGGLPRGDDIAFHAVRNEQAMDHFFSGGRLDGWSPRFLSGDQQFLLYGPGLALATTVVRMLSLGSLDAADALAWVSFLSWVLTAPAAWFLARGLGMRLAGASAAGLAALLVSVTFGVGPLGTFGVGLVPHGLAAPLALTVLGCLVRLVDRPERRWVTLSALAGLALAMTHLTTAVVTLAAFAVLLAAARLTGRLPPRTLRRLATSGVLAAGLGAIWLLPLVETRGPVGGVVTWPTARLLDRIRMAIDGTDWAHPLVAALAAVGAVVVAVWLLERSPRLSALGRWRWGVLAAGPGLLAILQTLHHRLDNDLAIFIAPRGMGLAMMLWTLPAVAVFDAVVARWRLSTALGYVALLSATVLMVDDAVPGRELLTTLGPVALELQDTADLLAAEVPDHGRFVFATEEGFPTSAFGPVHPELWLAWQSGRNTANGFPETVTPVDPFLGAAVIQAEVGAVEPWLERAGVTHLVATPAVADRYSATGGWETLDDDGMLHVLAWRSDIELAVTRSGDLDLRIASWSDERVTWSASGEGTAVLGLPDLKWSVAGDAGDVVQRTEDGYIAVDVPAGTSTITATFDRTAADRYGFVVSGAVAATWLGLPVLRRRRRRPEEEPDAVPKTSPEARGEDETDDRP